MRRLLILSCSAAKRPDAGLLPAIERYDGPRYRILRRYLRTHPGTELDVWVLSAEFGLIPGGEPIPTYDRVLTRARAAELAPQISAALPRAAGDHAAAFVVAGAAYVGALARCCGGIRPGFVLRVAPGGVGAKNGHLKRWLERGAA